MHVGCLKAHPKDGEHLEDGGEARRGILKKALNRPGYKFER
jgi:hypothetical protein